MLGGGGRGKGKGVEHHPQTAATGDWRLSREMTDRGEQDCTLGKPP